MLPVIAGAALGGLSSLLGGNKGATTTTTPDPQTQQIRDAIFHQAQGVASGPQYQGILGGYGGFSGLTNLGVGAMGGDQASLNHFMNPFLQNVLKQSNAQFGLLGQQVQNQVSDRATQAGAFGGSRAAIASGVAGANLARDQAQANSQLIYGGFNDAQQRAAQAAQTGLAGNQGYLNALGFPTQLYAAALPGGGSSTTSTYPGGGVGGFLSGALGGASLGAGLFGSNPAGSQRGNLTQSGGR